MSSATNLNDSHQTESAAERRAARYGGIRPPSRIDLDLNRGRPGCHGRIPSEDGFTLFPVKPHYSPLLKMDRGVFGEYNLEGALQLTTGVSATILDYTKHVSGARWNVPNHPRRPHDRLGREAIIFEFCCYSQ